MRVQPTETPAHSVLPRLLLPACSPAITARRQATSLTSSRPSRCAAASSCAVPCWHSAAAALACMAQARVGHDLPPIVEILPNCAALPDPAHPRLRRPQVYVQQQHPGNPGADACLTACLAALCCCCLVDCLT